MRSPKVRDQARPEPGSQPGVLAFLGLLGDIPTPLFFLK